MPTYPQVVGFTGYAGSGKDTAAYALAKHSFTWARLAFATKVKELLLALDPPLFDEYGTSLGSLHTHAPDLKALEKAKREPLIGALIRYMLQDLGHSVRTVIGPDTWINALEREWITNHQGQPLAIVDVRYENEADLVWFYDGIIIRVERPGTGPWNKHQSEDLSWAVPDGRSVYQVTNDSTPEALHAQVLSIVSSAKR